MEKTVRDKDISVIVPIYNVEEYLEECLQSLADQTKKDIEVIMVDDGSTDRSGAIAKSFAERYDDFIYFYKENGGLGCARNYGVERASGRYIAFVDSDDVVSLDLYEKMFTYAQRDHSELTICNVLRFDSKKVWASNLHKRVFKDIGSCTHITEDPDLIYDTVSWNKLILKSFYDKNHFLFPEGILYEDIPVTIPMHFKADRVSVVESSYYFWRVRDGATRSITQCTDSLSNLQDRVKILKMLDAFFAKNDISREYCLLKQKKALEVDLMIFVNECTSMPESTCRQMFEIINAYMDEAVEEEVFDLLPLISKQKYVYVRAYDIERLIGLLDYQSKDYYNAKVEKKAGRFIVTLPEHLFTLPDRDITDELPAYAPKRDITSIKIRPGGYRIRAYIYHSRIHISDPSEQKIQAYLENEMTGCLMPLGVVPVRDGTVTEMYGSMYDRQTDTGCTYDYDGASFEIDLDLESLEISDENRGYNRILVCYEDDLTKGKIRLSGQRKPMAGNAVILDDRYMGLQYDGAKELRVCLKDGNALAERLTAEDGRIRITLGQRADRLSAKPKEGETVWFGTEDGRVFEADADRFKRDMVYHLFWVDGEDTERKLFYRDKSILIQEESDPVVIFKTNQDHGVRFTVKDHVTCVEDMARSGRTIRLGTETLARGVLRSVPSRAYLYVDDDISGERTVLGESGCRAGHDRIGCAFLIDLEDEEVTKNLYTSWRDLRICYEGEGGQGVCEAIYSTKRYKINVRVSTLKVSIYRGNDGNIRFMSKDIWRKEEDTWQKRKALIAENYPKYRQEKIDPKCIIFESMWGAKYSCNPQHLYEYIDKNHPEYKCVWSLNDERIPIKGNGIRVRRHSQEYYHYLATAKYLVNNVNFPNEYIKREGQVEIQTMHGTPLKTFGLDVTDELPNENSRKKYIEKNSRWDHLIVQGRFMKEKAYSCFGFKKEILETGYPRTDILYNRDREQVLGIKKRLGLPLDKKVILYAPTWRVRGVFHMELDLERFKERFSDEYILLVRLHYFSPVCHELEPDNAFVFDLGSYRSIEDLYLISDMMITDYSSAMFDYVLLDKPMIFFIYDLEAYRDRLRGIYVDIESEAPGPIVYDTDGLITAIENLDDEVEACGGRIRAFKERYVGYENPDSCRMIVRKVIKPSWMAGSSHRLKQKIRSYVKLDL